MSANREKGTKNNSLTNQVTESLTKLNSWLNVYRLKHQNKAVNLKKKKNTHTIRCLLGVSSASFSASPSLSFLIRHTQADTTNTMEYRLAMPAHTDTITVTASTALPAAVAVVAAEVAKMRKYREL